MTTLVLNRSLLNVRRVEVVEAFALSDSFRSVTPQGLQRTVSPFGVPPNRVDDHWDIEDYIQEQEITVPWGNSETHGRATPLDVELNRFTSFGDEDRKAFDSRPYRFPSSFN